MADTDRIIKTRVQTLREYLKQPEQPGISWRIFSSRRLCRPTGRIWMNSFTFSMACVKLTLSMTFSEVSAVAPFQEIFTSEVTGTMSCAHSVTLRLGKVPFVVRLSRS